ncbi:MAG: hypothetical protein PHS92_03150 [Candidatus Gracilibacteria bacterium]|nr:hypothetical protein [Candidatus Gracilibacteria bacterium]
MAGETGIDRSIQENKNNISELQANSIQNNDITEYQGILEQIAEMLSQDKDNKENSGALLELSKKIAETNPILSDQITQMIASKKTTGEINPAVIAKVREQIDAVKKAKDEYIKRKAEYIKGAKSGKFEKVAGFDSSLTEESLMASLNTNLSNTRGSVEELFKDNEYVDRIFKLEIPGTKLYYKGKSLIPGNEVSGTGDAKSDVINSSKTYLNEMVDFLEKSAQIKDGVLKLPGWWPGGKHTFNSYNEKLFYINKILEAMNEGMQEQNRGIISGIAHTGVDLLGYAAIPVGVTLIVFYAGKKILPRIPILGPLTGVASEGIGLVRDKIKKSRASSEENAINNRPHYTIEEVEGLVEGTRGELKSRLNSTSRKKKISDAEFSTRNGLLDKFQEDFARGKFRKMSKEKIDERLRRIFDGEKGIVSTGINVAKTVSVTRAVSPRNIPIDPLDSRMKRIGKKLANAGLSTIRGGKTVVGTGVMAGLEVGRTPVSAIREKTSTYDKKRTAEFKSKVASYSTEAFDHKFEFSQDIKPIIEAIDSLSGEGRELEGVLKLHEKVSAINLEIGTNKDDITRIEGEVRAKVHEIEIKKQEINRFEKSRTSLVNPAIENEITAKTSEIESKNIEIESKILELEKSKQDLDIKKQELTSLKKSKTSTVDPILDSKIITVEQEIENIKLNIKTKNSEITLKNLEKEGLVNFTKSLINSTTDGQINVKNLEIQNKGIEITTIDSQISRLNRELTEINLNITSQSNALITTTNKAAKTGINNQITLLKGEKSRLELDIEEKTTKKEEKLTEKSELENKLEELKNNKSISTEEKVAELKKQQTVLEGELVKLKDDLDAHKAEKTELKEKLKEAKTKVEGAKFNTMAETQIKDALARKTTDLNTKLGELEVKKGITVNTLSRSIDEISIKDIFTRVAKKAVRK